MRLTIFFISIILFLGSCKKDNEETLYPETEPLPEEISFSVNVLPIINNSCATIGCHVQGGSANGIFENYNQIKAKVDNGSFKQRVVVSKDMPPSGNLPKQQIDIIEQWILDGAPNN